MTTAFIPFMVEIFLGGFALIAVVLIAFKRSMPYEKIYFSPLAFIVLISYIQMPAKFYIPAPFVDKTPIAMLLTVLILATMGVAVCPKRCRDEPESFVFILLSVLGLVTMVSASHLMALYVGIELATFPVLAWIALRRDNSRALEGALKYFVLSALASGIMLFGMALIFCGGFSLSYPGLLEAQINPLFLIGVCLVLVGLMFKLGLAPFHFWLPDVYQACTVRQAAYISISMKIAAVGAMIGLVTALDTFFNGLWPYIFGTAGVLSVLVGSFAALWQKNLKRLLAYSGISHMGFIAFTWMGVSSVNTISGLFYLGVYLMSLVVVWKILIFLEDKEGEEIDQCRDLSGLAQTHPRQAFWMTVALVSLMGLPPLPVFFGKLRVLLILVTEQYLWLAVFLVMMTVVSAFYSLRLIRYIYFCPPEEMISGHLGSAQ
jgi:NADH-quinone oxidoreductase subunit N